MGILSFRLPVFPSVRLSARLPVKRVHCDKTEERYVMFLYNTKDHVAWFSEKKNGWWGEVTPST